MKLSYRFARIALTISFAFGSLLLTGCGSSSATVEGSVSYDGTPIDSGAVVFVPTGETKGQKIGSRIVDGKYVVDEEQKLPPGKYQVIINWNKKTGRKIQDGDGAGVRDETKEGLPAKFNTATTQTAEVKGGKNQIDFPLTSK